ncbi:MAG: ankyrin repeat domain-containing protein [Phycisphaeraceae bacterium]|nr:ankyrin repeat domain-containing protein [Phycisphaeraceae bacterium]
MPTQRDIDAFHEAAEKGDLMALMPMVQADRAILRAKADHGDEPIHTACWQKQMLAVSFMIQQGADVNARGCNGMTPLHCALSDSDEQCVPLVAILIESGADPSLKEDGGSDVEFWARQEVYAGVEEVLELISQAKPKES